MEYEYAVKKGKPLFAVVIDEGYLNEKVKKDGLQAIEKDHSEKLKGFRTMVCSRMVRFWKDPKDIKLAIMETMADFTNREDLVGWIPRNEEINTGMVAEEIAELTKENKELREQLKSYQTSAITYSGLSFDEMYNLLASTKLHRSAGGRYRHLINDTATLFGDPKPGLLHMFWVYSKLLQQEKMSQSTEFIENLEEFGLIEKHRNRELVYGIDHYRLTDYGKQFLIKLRTKKMAVIDKADLNRLTEYTG